MSTGTNRRQRTTVLKNKQDLVEGRHVIDITDERLAARRREDFQRTLGALSAIHHHDGGSQPDKGSGWWRRLTGRSKH